MAISGTGVQGDPFVVTTWDELVTAAGDIGSYVKLGNDIDLNDEYPSGIPATLVLDCVELDGDGYKIKNLVSNNLGNVFQMGQGTSISIKNFKLLNFLIVSAFSDGVLFNATGKTINFELCQFSGRFFSESNYLNLFGSGTINLNRCSHYIESQGKFRTVAEDNQFQCNYCNMKFIGDITNNLYFVFNNSYLTGKVTGGAIWCVTGSIQSILDIECPEINGNSATHVFANSDKCPSISIATPITNNQMKSADALFNLGLLIQR